MRTIQRWSCGRTTFLFLLVLLISLVEIVEGFASNRLAICSPANHLDRRRPTRTPRETKRRRILAIEVQQQQQHLWLPRTSKTSIRTSTQLTDHAHHSSFQYTAVLAGKIWPAVQKLFVTKAKFNAIVTNVTAVFGLEDLITLLFFVYGPTRIARLVHSILHRIRRRGQGTTTSTTATTSPIHTLEGPSVGGTTTAATTTTTTGGDFGISNFISEAAQVGLTCICVDFVALILTTLGFQWVQKYKIAHVFTQFAYTIWTVRKVLVFKTMALHRAFQVHKHSTDETSSGSGSSSSTGSGATIDGRLEIIDHLVTGIIVTLVGVCLLDSLPFKTDLAVNSILGLGSVGTLTFTLASQGLVTQFLSGLFLTATNKMYAGDYVLFGDGSSGTVIKMGWMETQLRAGDNSILKIPNSQLANQKMSNLSRVKESLVKQTLRFHYEDIDKMPELLQTIREEIIAACPRLITNGVRPFRVYFTGYKEDHLEVEVTTHHRLAPIGDAFHINRQHVLFAIHKAVQRCGVQFARLEAVTTGREPLWRVLPKQPQE